MIVTRLCKDVVKVDKVFFNGSARRATAGRLDWLTLETDCFARECKTNYDSVNGMRRGCLAVQRRLGGETRPSVRSGRPQTSGRPPNLDEARRGREAARRRIRPAPGARHGRRRESTPPNIWRDRQPAPLSPRGGPCGRRGRRASDGRSAPRARSSATDRPRDGPPREVLFLRSRARRRRSAIHTAISCDEVARHAGAIGGARRDRRLGSLRRRPRAGCHGIPARQLAGLVSVYCSALSDDERKRERGARASFVSRVQSLLSLWFDPPFVWHQASATTLYAYLVL